MRRGKAPNPAQLDKETSRIKKLRSILSDRIAEKLSAPDLTIYFDRRREGMKRSQHGGRAVDLELQALKACLVWSVQHGLLAANPIATRPKFGTAPVRHCRDCMPADAEELHALAATLFEDRKSEALGWQLLLEAFTGCRTGEILRLRWDAPNRGAGFIEGDHLWLQRSKGGVNPFCCIHPSLADALRWLRIWSNIRHPGSPWFIPSTRAKGQAMYESSLTHALKRIGPIVSGAHRTSHGLRAYYVTVRRSDGVADGQIAAEIGDSSGAAIISSTYGSIPPNWQGAAGLSWLPKGAAAWTVLGLPDVVTVGNSWYTGGTTAKTESL